MVKIAPDAAEKLKELIQEQNKGKELPTLWGLRLYVQGGGCSGFQYGLQIEEQKQESDLVVESNGIRVFIDPISHTYVEGVLIYWKSDGVTGGFAIENPNAKSTCGCGQSFNTE